MMNNALINFEEKFRAFLLEYENENDVSGETLEQIVPQMYLDWLSSPKDWLSGLSPVSYFKEYDAAALIEALGGYVIGGIPLPGALLNRIADEKESTYPYLLTLLQNYDGEKRDKVKIAIIRLIEEMELPHPYEFYLDIITSAEEQNDLAEACVDELRNSGDVMTDRIIEELDRTDSRYVSDCLLDILTDLPYDERTFQFALEKFLYSDSDKAFYANCLGKIGNEKAMPILEDTMKSDEANYYDYVAIRNAIEELGGEVHIDRDFSGDKDFEALKNMGE